MPNGVRWVQIALALTTHRRRPGAVEHPAGGRRSWPRSCASPRCSSWSPWPSSAGTGISTISGRSWDRPRNFLRCARVWPAGRLEHSSPRVTRPPRLVDALTGDGHRQKRPTRHHVHLRQQRAAQGRACTPHGNALAAVRSGARRPLHRLGPPGCICRCRSSGWAASAAVCSPRCWPAPPWSPRRFPSRRPRLRLLERERVTLFRGWPDQAEARARQADSIGADLSALRPGSLEALLPPRQRAEPGARADVVRHDRGFRSVLRLSRRHRHAAIRLGQLRQALRRALARLVS